MEGKECFEVERNDKKRRPDDNNNHPNRETNKRKQNDEGSDNQRQHDESIQPCMTKEEMKSFYKTADSILVSLEKPFCHNQKAAVDMHPSMAAMSELALAAKNSNPKKLLEMDFKKYRWIVRFSFNVQDGQQIKTVFSQPLKMDNATFLLQLKTKTKNVEKWTDWLEVRKSESHVHPTFGVFASRQIPKGCTIGYWCGLETFFHTQDRTVTLADYRPKHDNLIARSHRNLMGDYAMIENSKDGPFYFGLQFIQNLASQELSGEFLKKRKKDVNVMYLSDGRLIATKMIHKGTEFLLNDKEQTFDPSSLFSISKMVVNITND